MRTVGHALDIRRELVVFHSFSSVFVMILLQSFSQFLQAGSYRDSFFREVNWCLLWFFTTAILYALIARQGNTNIQRTPRTLSLTTRTNDNVVTIGITRIVRSSVPSGVSDPAVLCVEETPSLSSISSVSTNSQKSFSTTKKMF